MRRALLESGTGNVHAVNQRIARVWRARFNRDLPVRARFISAGVLLTIAMFFAECFGLVALIASGYRTLVCVDRGVRAAATGVWRLAAGKAAGGLREHDQLIGSMAKAIRISQTDHEYRPTD